MKKILVPVDFSENSKKAVRFAAEIAVRTGAQLEIIHVNTTAAYVPVLPEYYPIPHVDVTDYAESVSSDLKKIKQSLTALREFENLSVETRIEEGYLHHAISRVVQQDGCDLVVMGTQGVTGAAEFFVGSNTEKVIRTAPCPVLTVPEEAGDFKLEKVVLATTLRPDQVVAFETLAAWQQVFDFEVKLLYLNNPAGLADTEAIDSTLQEFLKMSGLKQVDVFSASNVYNEEQTILKFAEETQSDLIVMATHQRRGISHLMFGSLTEDAANHSEVPVLCVPIQN